MAAILENGIVYLQQFCKDGEEVLIRYETGRTKYKCPKCKGEIVIRILRKEIAPMRKGVQKKSSVQIKSQAFSRNGEGTL